MVIGCFKAFNQPPRFKLAGPVYTEKIYSKLTESVHQSTDEILN